jgi:hypothetical protein
VHSRPHSISEVARRLLAQVAREHGPTATEEQVMLALPHYVSDFRHELLIAGVSPASFESAPALTGNTAVDAYLAGVAETLANRLSVPPPMWTEAPVRFLQRPVFFGGPSVRDEIVSETPIAWSRRGLFVGDTFRLDRGR